MIEYKDLIFDEDHIMSLYLDNEWYNYTNNKEQLFEGIKNSLDVIGAYDKGNLVGLIRTVGDKTTILYIQDILVKKAYQRQGIGTKLVQRITTKYADCLHIILTTDDTEKTKAFYESIGFISYNDIHTVGYKFYGRDKQ